MDLGGGKSSNTCMNFSRVIKYYIKYNKSVGDRLYNLTLLMAL